MESKNSLAIHGGEPVRRSYLPYGRQSIDEEDVKAVLNVLKSDYVTQGPKIIEFEQEIAQYTNAKFAVAFSSGTAALHAACYAAGITNGDEVITTPITFSASANCVLYQHGVPIFADIQEDSLNISPQSIEQKITKKTKAIIPVDFTGRPSNLDEIKSIAKKYDLVVIEDAAHALGGVYKGNKIGSISDMTMFSFHPVKQITTGEGGMITTNDRSYYETLMQFRTHGITRDRKDFQEDHGAWYYEMQTLGFNYRMTDIQAELGRSQLKKLDDFIEKRKQIVQMYHHAFSKMKELQIPSLKAGEQSSWHLYVIRLNKKTLSASRKMIFDALKKENIGVNVHYIPVYWHPYYEKLGYKKQTCPHAEVYYEEAITLPLFPAMSNEDVKDVIKAVNKVIFYYSKEKNV